MKAFRVSHEQTVHRFDRANTLTGAKMVEPDSGVVLIDFGGSYLERQLQSLGKASRELAVFVM